MTTPLRPPAASPGMPGATVTIRPGDTFVFSGDSTRPEPAASPVAGMPAAERCSWTWEAGRGLVAQCELPLGHAGDHVGMPPAAPAEPLPTTYRETWPPVERAAWLRYVAGQATVLETLTLAAAELHEVVQAVPADHAGNCALRALGYVKTARERLTHEASMLEVPPASQHRLYPCSDKRNCVACLQIDLDDAVRTRDQRWQMAKDAKAELAALKAAPAAPVEPLRGEPRPPPTPECRCASQFVDFCRREPCGCLARNYPAASPSPVGEPGEMTLEQACEAETGTVEILIPGFRPEPFMPAATCWSPAQLMAAKFRRRPQPQPAPKWSPLKDMANAYLLECHRCQRQATMAEFGNRVLREFVDDLRRRWAEEEGTREGTFSRAVREWWLSTPTDAHGRSNGK